MTEFPLRIGTAGWTIPSRYAERMRQAGSHLQRYAERLNAVEINSSFHRPHQQKPTGAGQKPRPTIFAFR